MRFTIGKVKIQIGFFFFAAAAYFLSAEMWKNYLCAVLFASLHECGHWAALSAFHCPIGGITLGPVGMRIEKRELPLSYRQECVVALCGPAVNLLCMALCLYGKEFSQAFSLPFAINTGLFTVNMLPIEPLDGGRILHMFLLMRTSPETVEKVLKTTETGIVLLLVVVLLLSLIFDFVNTSFVLFTVGLTGMIVMRLIFPGKWAKNQS